MTAAAPALTLGDAARMMRDALKDRSYRATPLGLEVGRYLRWKRIEWGASESTLAGYEGDLRRTCTFFADLHLRDLEPPMGVERLRECWDHHWGDCSGRTRAKVRSVWVDFFDWACREAGPDGTAKMYGNPARLLAVPKKRHVRRDPFTEAFVHEVISRQEYEADKLAVRLILEYALRRGELIGVRMGDFDMEREKLVVTGKGTKVRRVPIPDPAFWGDLLRFKLEVGADATTYLLYTQDTRRVFCDKAEATEALNIRGQVSYYRWRTLRDHSHEIGSRTAHEWWYRCLHRAGFMETQGSFMHRGRHTVATEILRKSGNIVAAQKLLGHESVETTVRAYAQWGDEDTALVLKAIRGLG